MSKPVNKTLIGGFVVGAVVLLVTALVVLGSGKFFQRTYPFVMYFEGSVSGLNVGAPVLFRGVKVGAVKEIQLVGNPKDLSLKIPVTIELEPYRIRVTGEVVPKRDLYRNVKILIERGLRAQLQTQSFVTGLLQIALDLYPDKPARYVGTGKIPEIPTVPTKLEELSRSLEKLPLDQLATDISQAVQSISRLAQSPAWTETLHATADSAKEIRELVHNLEDRIGAVAASANETVLEYGKLARNLDGQVSKVASTTDATVKQYGKLAANLNSRVDPLTASVEGTLKTAQVALKQGEKTLSNTQAMTATDSPVMHEVTRALQELSAASRSIRILADYLERHPEALIQGKGGPRGR